MIFDRIVTALMAQCHTYSYLKNYAVIVQFGIKAKHSTIGQTHQLVKLVRKTIEGKKYYSFFPWTSQKLLTIRGMTAAYIKST